MIAGALDELSSLHLSEMGAHTGHGIDVQQFTDSTAFTSTPITNGTSIVSLTFPGGVVIAADTRTSQGPIISDRASRKIHMVHHRLAAAASGSLAVSYTLKQMLKVQIDQHAQELNSPGGYFEGNLPMNLPTVYTAAMLAKNPIYDYKDQLKTSFMIAGWDQKRGGQLYCIPLGGTLLKQSYAADGSGAAYMMALLDSKYKENMTKEACQLLAKQCIAHSIYRDSASGGMIRVVTITKEAVEETLMDGNALPFDP